MSDISEALVGAIQEARAQRRPVYIRGGNSKADILGRACEALPLEVTAHQGIVDYQPAELVVIVRAGTTISDLSRTLAEQQQVMAFEPPLGGGRGTVGGTLACNLSGPARPWLGSMRDAVLGVQLINGKAELLNFGGKVMKNVAGYDVSRLQAGALGTLGLVTQVSLKVIPMPEVSLTLRFDVDARTALDTITAYSRLAKPLTGACWYEGQLYLRLAGAEAAVKHTAQLWGGEHIAARESPWEALRELNLPCLAQQPLLWRQSVAASAPLSTEYQPILIDWGGARRWYRGADGSSQLQALASEQGGHLCLFRGGDRNSETGPQLDPVQRQLHQQLKQAFDPDRLLNPGRLYSWM